MSSYKNRVDFISRTLSLFDKYEKDCGYEKTLFLNFCLGLLVIPQQCAAQDSNLHVTDIVDDNSWGINIDKIKENETVAGLDKNSAENIARHIRNSITHYRFDIIKANANLERIKMIHLKDFSIVGGEEKVTFDLTLEFNDFKKFVLKYAKEKKEKLKTV